MPVTATDSVTGARVQYSLPVRVFASKLPAWLGWVEEPGRYPRQVLFVPEDEKDGVISGTTNTVEGWAPFTYNVQTERLHIVSGEGGPSAEYWSICEPSTLTCTGTGPRGGTTFTS